MYVLLGVLAGLLLLGTVWDIFVRKKGKINQNIVEGEDEYFMAKRKSRFQSCSSVFEVSFVQRNH